MRIVGGRFRGLKLAGFDVKAIRPTTDRVREALFNILAHNADLRSDAGPFLSGAAVLDAFAGTGALGLEALSRGAHSVIFIERDAAASALLRDNVRRARASDSVQIVSADALQPPRARAPVDLVLMDPPYGQGLAGPALKALEKAGWIVPATLIVIEMDARDDLDLPAAFVIEDERKYGRSRLVFARVG